MDWKSKLVYTISISSNLKGRFVSVSFVGSNLAYVAGKPHLSNGEPYSDLGFLGSGRADISWTYWIYEFVCQATRYTAFKDPMTNGGSNQGRIMNSARRRRCVEEDVLTIMRHEAEIEMS